MKKRSCYSLILLVYLVLAAVCTWIGWHTAASYVFIGLHFAIGLTAYLIDKSYDKKNWPGETDEDTSGFEEVMEAVWFLVTFALPPVILFLSIIMREKSAVDPFASTTSSTGK